MTDEPLAVRGRNPVVDFGGELDKDTVEGDDGMLVGMLLLLLGKESRYHPPV